MGHLYKSTSLISSHPHSSRRQDSIPTRRIWEPEKFGDSCPRITSESVQRCRLKCEGWVLSPALVFVAHHTQDLFAFKVTQRDDRDVLWLLRGHIMSSYFHMLKYMRNSTLTCWSFSNNSRILWNTRRRSPSGLAGDRAVWGKEVTQCQLFQQERALKHSSPSPWETEGKPFHPCPAFINGRRRGRKGMHFLDPPGNELPHEKVLHIIVVFIIYFNLYKNSMKQWK